MINRCRWTDKETEVMMRTISKYDLLHDGFKAASQKLHRSLSGIMSRYYYIKKKGIKFEKNKTEIISLNDGQVIPCCGDVGGNPAYKVGNQFIILKQQQ